jgi:parallel beta-helix repeat protein
MFKKLIYLISLVLVLGLAGEGWAKASNPDPRDGIIFKDTWVTLSWQPSDLAVSFNIYVGENYDDVKYGTGGTFRSNLSTMFFILGFPGYPYPDGLVPGTTYYWRVDEVNNQHGDNISVGDVWSFTIPYTTAYDPEPADGAMFVEPDVTLSWEPGFGSKLHIVYFGDNFDKVQNATEGIIIGMSSYNPGILESGKTYYWRVDEFDDSITHKGDVWSFTVGAGAPPVGERGIIYVDSLGGDDNNNGLTPRTPFATIQKGIDAAPEGSTVLVAPGSYEENIIMKERVHLRGSGPSVTFISGEGKQLRSTLILWAVIWAADHSILEGFTITVTPPENSTNHYAVQGYTEDRNDPIIANNVFTGGSGNCLISFWGGSPRIVNNTFFDNQPLDSLISVNNHMRSGIPVVANNIFANNQSLDVVRAINGAQPEVSFNMLWDNRIRNEDFRGFTPGLGNKWENPCFIDPDSGDLRLSPSSPAIDAGDNDSILPFLPADMPGNSRVVNGTIDMGAYEYSAVPASKVYYVDAVNGSDDNNGFTINTAFSTIQKGIATAADGETVLVYPGLYVEEINFMGKALMVQGVAVSPAGVPVLWNPSDFAVSYYSGEGHNSILKNFIIKDSFMGVFIADSSPTLKNLTIVNNKYGIEAYADSEPDITNCIIWNNTDGDLFGCMAMYSCVERGDNYSITADPLFVDPDNNDYHIRSERGRYWPRFDIWVLDKVTSPCVDAGNPDADISNEPMPNGGRINIGAYGGTVEASLSPDERPYPLSQKASNPYPTDGAENVELDIILTWTPSLNAVLHDVYIGTDREAVANADTSSIRSGIYRGRQSAASYTQPPIRYPYRQYYWRIDEIDSEGNTRTGDVWTFTTISPPPPKGRACFLPETLVLMEGKFVQIRNVTSSRTIESLQEHEGTFVCRDIVLETGNSISVVDAHCFMIDSGQWIAAQNLTTGLRLKTLTGTVGIKSITTRSYTGKVYNLKILDSDRYMVGKDSVIVRDF